MQSRTVTSGTCAVRRLTISHQTRVSEPHVFAGDCTGHDVPEVTDCAAHSLLLTRSVFMFCIADKVRTSPGASWACG